MSIVGLHAARNLLEIMTAGRWIIVWDVTFQSARKIKLAERSQAEEILMGDEFSVTILDVSCCLRTEHILDVSFCLLTSLDVLRYRIS